jgi:hypothetical protein
MKARLKETGKWITVDTCTEGFYDVETHDIYEPDELDFAPAFDWDAYRMEAAKDILASIVVKACEFSERHKQKAVEIALQYADELIKQLQEK